MNRAAGDILAFYEWLNETPGIVYYIIVVVRRKMKACDEKEGNFNGKAENQNQIEGF